MKILKNTTIDNILINDTGISILANSSYAIVQQDYSLWSSSSDIVSKVTNGSIIVNDGINDLSIDAGLAYLQYPDHALNIRFDNATNGFTSTDVQHAIEEAKSSGTGTAGIPELTEDPINPPAESSWVLKQEHGTPIGLLLSLTRVVSTVYKFSYKTKSGAIKRTDLT